MECKTCGVLSGTDESYQGCTSFENEAMVPMTVQELYATHTWVREWPHSEYDPNSSDGANLDHMKYLLEGYRDRVIGDPHTPDNIGRKYSFESARDISWTMGWKKADEDLRKIGVKAP